MKVRVQVMIEQDVFDQLKIEADEKQISVSAIARQKIASMIGGGIVNGYIPIGAIKNEVLSNIEKLKNRTR